MVSLTTCRMCAGQWRVVRLSTYLEIALKHTSSPDKNRP